MRHVHYNGANKTTIAPIAAPLKPRTCLADAPLAAVGTGATLGLLVPLAELEADESVVVVDNVLDPLIAELTEEERLEAALVREEPVLEAALSMLERCDDSADLMEDNILVTLEESSEVVVGNGLTDDRADEVVCCA